MPPDVRINNVETEIGVFDASSFLSPAIMRRIVQAVTEELRRQKSNEEERQREQRLGGSRSRSSRS